VLRRSRFADKHDRPLPALIEFLKLTQHPDASPPLLLFAARWYDLHFENRLFTIDE